MQCAEGKNYAREMCFCNFENCDNYIYDTILYRHEQINGEVFEFSNV